MSPHVSSSSASHGQVGIDDKDHTRISPRAVPLTASVGGEKFPSSDPDLSPPTNLTHVTGSEWPTHRPNCLSQSNPTPCSGVPRALGGKPKMARS